MEFRAGIYATGYFGHGLTTLFLLVVCVFIYIGEYNAASVLAGVVTITVARLYTRKMSFDDHVFRYDGWFGFIEIPYSEIVKVENSSSLGYPIDRWYGPFEYRVTTKGKKWWVSLLWFNGAAARQFHEQIIKRKQG